MSISPLQARFGSLPLLVIPKAKIALEREEILNATAAQYTRSVNVVSLPTD